MVVKNIDPTIFKAYDIRGIYPDQLDEVTAYLIGRAFVEKTSAKTVIVGSDMRLSGPQLKEELIRGIIEQGADVLDIGLMPIDAVYFAVGILKYPAGIMITASHNPKEYNGFKMVVPGIDMIRGQDLLTVVENLPSELPAKKGQVKSLDILDKYLEHTFSFCDLDKIKSFKVVVDAGNGMAGKVIPLLAKRLPVKVIPLNFELDGNFPAHPSNPLLPESQEQISLAVKEQGADFGVIFDGDSDRLFFVDETGRFIPADITLLILAKEFLTREPGSSIVYNAICSKIVPEKIIEWGGRPIRAKVGFVNISMAMKQNNAIMGGELAAHYAFRDNAYADSGFIAWLILLQLLSQDGRNLSAIVKDFEKYFKSPETNLEVHDSQKIISEIKKKYQSGKQDELDGLTVQYNNWWFNIRPSNTEPLLRVTIETDNKKLLDEKHQELTQTINQLNNANN